MRESTADGLSMAAARDRPGVSLATVSRAEQRKVILGSSLGTVFEWYDFYLYGALAGIIAVQFSGSLNENNKFLFALMAFAAGFFVRPFGAIFFGRLGDLIGRKYTFLITIVVMGVSTVLVGLLPGYATIGVAAPILLIVLRMLQGLALGGEYGGAAVYVAEHAPAHQRGYITSWIQTTATLGLFLSLLVILGTRTLLGEEAFAAWGWRIPFLISAVLLLVSVWIRSRLAESPLYQQMKAAGRASKRPLGEAFGNWPNLRLVIIALFGLVAGQAVVWYTGQFYALFFLTQTLKVDSQTANLMIAASLLIGTPFFIFFGWLSDKIGRKVIILAGCLLAALTYFPLFDALTKHANPALYAAIATTPVTVAAAPEECTFQFDPLNRKKYTTPCDIARNALVKRGVPYTDAPGTVGAAEIRIGDTVVPSYSGTGDDVKAKGDAFQKALGEALAAAAYPAKADVAAIDYPVVIGILTLLVIYVTMVYGPIAALLVELFPTRIRYTSLSLPYHLGNGWFGGFLPITAFAIVAATGNIYSGLWYPVIVASATFVIGLIFVREKRGQELTD